MNQPTLFDDSEVECRKFNLDPERPVCKSGDLWHLDKHRMYCGDSTELESYETLFGDKKHVLCFTSPPYDNQRTYNLKCKLDWYLLMLNVSQRTIAYMVADGNYLVNLGLVHEKRQVKFYWQVWLDWMEENEWPLFGWYVWDKMVARVGEPHGRLMECFEFIYHFSNKLGIENKTEKTTGKKGRPMYTKKDGLKRGNRSPKKMGQPYKAASSIISISNKKNDFQNQNHPAVFPIELPEFVYKVWSNEGSIVFDPFLGSGTSILAAEKTKRIGYGMEIDPFYCTVALERYYRYTGKEPVRMDGKKYLEVKSE